MKNITITKIGVMSLANFAAAMGAVTGAIKAIVLPVFALVAAGTLGDVDTAIKGISDAISKDIGNVISFAIAGWIGGAVYALIANEVLKITKGITLGTNQK